MKVVPQELILSVWLRAENTNEATNLSYVVTLISLLITPEVAPKNHTGR